MTNTSRFSLAEGVLRDALTDSSWPLEDYFLPTFAWIFALQPGDHAPNCFGELCTVTEIVKKGVSIAGRAYVCVTVEFGPTSTISNSFTEGRLDLSTKITARHTSHELRLIEALLCL